MPGGGYHLRGATMVYNAVFWGGYYSRGATKQRGRLFEEIRYLKWQYHSQKFFRDFIWKYFSIEKMWIMYSNWSNGINVYLFVYSIHFQWKRLCFGYFVHPISPNKAPVQRKIGKICSSRNSCEQFSRQAFCQHLIYYTFSTSAFCGKWRTTCPWQLSSFISNFPTGSDACFVHWDSNHSKTWSNTMWARLIFFLINAQQSHRQLFKETVKTVTFILHVLNAQQPH